MATWESYPYQFGIELLQDYEPLSEVTIFTQDSLEPSSKHKFKGWCGIISHAHSKLKYGKASICVVMKSHDPIIVTVHEDKNSTVMCYPLAQEIKWQRMLDRNQQVA